tara:strand:+ start:665 stop:1747 length:1083 start_codon:yes stop_codon:yes gene_type:complete
LVLGSIKIVVTAKVIGAGSIGNHLSHALRQLGAEVTIVDVDKAALDRTRDQIYPTRYGVFDQKIQLKQPEEVNGISYDLCVIGTPPDTHLPIAQQELSVGHRALLIEKPLAGPGRAELLSFVDRVAKSNCRVLVAYNQRLKTNTVALLQKLQEASLGPPTLIRGKTREDWSGILAAHPWINNVTDSYLSYTSRGGGALYEHSHGLDFALYIAHELGCGRPKKVISSMDTVEHEFGSYDKEVKIEIETTEGTPVEVNQDLYTLPPDKSLEIRFVRGWARWEMHGDHDQIQIVRDGFDPDISNFAKERPDDFLPEISHVMELLDNPTKKLSPLDLSESVWTSLTLEAALQSSKDQKWVMVEK